MDERERHGVRAADAAFGIRRPHTYTPNGATGAQM